MFSKNVKFVVQCIKLENKIKGTLILQSLNDYRSKYSSKNDVKKFFTVERIRQKNSLKKSSKKSSKKLSKKSSKKLQTY